MAALLAKFRIDYSDVIVIPDVTKKASDSTVAEFDEILSPLPDGLVDQEELKTIKDKTNRQLRLAELLRHYSRDSQMIMM